MTQARKPRIALEPNALQALKIWAALEYEDPSALAGKIILDHMPARVKDLIAPMPSEGKGTIEVTQRPPQKRQKKVRLVDDLEAVEKIKQMWNSGLRNQTKIALEIGYPKSTTTENIREMIKKGDLKE